jgi:hypothetical protein
MTIRLSITARGKWRWVPVSSKKIIAEANDTIIQRADEINSEVTPKLTGNLQESFRHEIEEDGRRVRFFWDAPYAIYTDEGFPKSEGRYVPAIDKRLVSKELPARQQVYREALSQMFSPRAARVALTIKIRHTDKLPRYVDGRFTVSKSGKMKILLRKGLSPEREQVTTRHELWHAVEYAQEPRYLGVEAESEERARFFAIKSGLQERNIGTHPGFKGHHFSEKFLDQLREDVVSIVETVIDKELSK